MRLILTHITPQRQDYEQIVVEGDDYDRLLLDAMAQIPAGRITANIRVEREYQ